MSNSYRIRTQVGVDKYINVALEQDFESLEILSLKILQSQVYTRQCSDYGVVIGRVSINNGFGLPNAKVSIFIPLSEEDESNQVISELYPYKSVSDLNDDGYRYNLLPYTPSHSGHNPTGTFPTREDVLIKSNLIEVFDKYYKYTSKTNDSGDFMIFGVPIGEQTIHIDIDLSDIGEFSLSPQDLVRMGVANELQVNGTQFRTSTNLAELPQIISINRNIEVAPLWGQPEICSLGITRTDVDLSSEANIVLQPTSIFMGSIFSNTDAQAIKRRCAPPLRGGEMCNLTTGPGEILAIRQTIQQDALGRPILELHELENSGKVIDDNGTWLIDVPMNLDYVYTNEFGERTISNDPKIGVPTKGRYRFKVKWEQPPTLKESVKRANFLVPNIKEWGWTNSNADPLTNNSSTTDTQCYNPYAGGSNPNPDAVASYAFSLDWTDYGTQQMIQEAIDCDDRFYEMYYNKVYTISQLITEYRKGAGKRRMTVVKNILDDVCDSTNYRFPSNEAQYRPNIIFLLSKLLLQIMLPILITLVVVGHAVKLIAKILYLLVGFIKIIVCALKEVFCEIAGLTLLGFHPFGFFQPICNLLTGPCNFLKKAADELKKISQFTIKLPNLLYNGPGDCELCDCAIPDLSKETESAVDDPTIASELGGFNDSQGLNSFLTKFKDFEQYSCVSSNPYYVQLFVGDSSNAPKMVKVNQEDANSDRVFTTNVTYPERLNLFNTKAKYFNTSLVNNQTNPGGAVNRIRTTFQSDLNSSGTTFHLDNVIVLMVDANDSTDFTVGNMLSFTSPDFSIDPNLDILPTYNEYGNKAITGTTVSTVNTNGEITITYANPDGSGNNLQTIYQYDNPPNSQLFAKFKVDMEYFQVIHSTTVGQFLSENVFDNDTLGQRFISKGVNYIKIKQLLSIDPWADNNKQELLNIPYNCFNGMDDQKLIFLVRGVDPNSTRVPCVYDLSRLYGYPLGTWGQKIVTGNFKLNIPIQGTTRCVRHDAPEIIADSTDVDAGYSNLQLFYDSYGFIPGNQFVPFTSNTPSYYCTTTGQNIQPNSFVANSSFGARIPNTNRCTLEFICPKTFDPNLFPNERRYVSRANTTGTRNRGYFSGEIVEGGSFQGITINQLQNSFCNIPNVTGKIINSWFPPTLQSFYFSSRYSDTMQMNIQLGSSGNQIVMRSDRLPMSTGISDNGNSSYPMHTNKNFSVFIVSDDGSIQDPSLLSPAEAGSGDSDDNLNSLSGSDGELGILESLNPNYNGTDNALVDTFTCEGLAPLGCYQTEVINNISTIVVPPKSLDEECWRVYDPLSDLFGVQPDKKYIMEGGCYVLLNFTMTSIIRDWQLVIEWVFRTKVNFALCQNVFSHIFTNSWINGALYMFPFKNNRRFTGPNATPPNAPYSCYCHHLMYLDENTNSFYYRSSPYNQNTGDFIGRTRNPAISINPINPCIGNERNLMYPTTVVDLGPRNGYITELTFDDNYRGYFVDKLNSTSFNSVSELLNTFAISRLSNASFIGQILGALNPVPGVDPVDRFFSRQCRKVDGDYAQMVAINSQLGVTPYEDTEYNSPTDMFSSGANVGDNVFGIFFKSDQEIRDLLSPRREIITLGGAPNAVCTFNYLPNFSQIVPFYQWNVLNNNDVVSIFGAQTNDWYTLPVVGNSFLQNNYQLMDRIGNPSRFPQPTDQSQENYFKGYIFNVVGGFQTPNLGPNGRETNGNPYYFYFGLNMGKSAYDRFLTKWVKTDIVEQ